MTLPGEAQIDRRHVVRRELRHDEPTEWHPKDEEHEHERAPQSRVEANPWPGKRFENILNRADPAHRPTHEPRARDGDADERKPEDAADGEPERSGKMRFDQGKVHENEEHLDEPAASFGRESVGMLRRWVHHEVDDTIAATIAPGRGSRGRRQYGRVNMRIALLRGAMALVALGELAWSFLYYFRPDLALGTLGRTVVDPVIARQYPLYLASAAIAYALAARDPLRYRSVVWICVVQRGVEIAAAVIDWRAHAIPTPALTRVALIESGVALGLVVLMRGIAANVAPPGALDPRDRGLVRMLRGFGGLQLFWFFASTIFVQFGARLLGWKLQDPYTTQQQGIALLVIGLVSLGVASNVSRYRLFVAVPIASQVIGMVNAFNEIRLGTIGWNAAAVQWTIQCAIVGGFVYFMRHRIGAVETTPVLAE